MRLNADIDARFLKARTLKEQKRLAYNVAQALNEAAKSIQAQIRADMAQDFTLRSTTKKNKKWLLERVKIKFASVKRGLMAAEIYLDSKPRLLLGKYERGGTREPFVGKHVAIPNPEVAREGGSEAGQIKQELTFKDLRLKPVRVTPKTRPDDIQFKGLQRTFLLKSTAKNPLGGVYQRVGPGKDDIRLVWSFKRAFALKRMLHIVETARKLFPGKFRVELVLAYAKGKVGLPPA